MSVFNFAKYCLKGNRLSTNIPEETYKVEVERCINNLHGRLITSKSNMALKALELCDELLKLWSPITNWDLTLLGYEYFKFLSKSMEELNNILM